MEKWHRVAWALVGAVVVGALALYLAWGFSFSTPEITRHELGGSWYVETTRSLGGTSGGHSALYRQTEGGPELVESIVFKETYVGDGCVVFATPTACWVACDQQQPVLVLDHCDRWEIAEGVFRSLGEGVPTIEISVVELKEVAMSQGDNTTED